MIDIFNLISVSQGNIHKEHTNKFTQGQGSSLKLDMLRYANMIDDRLLRSMIINIDLFLKQLMNIVFVSLFYSTGLPLLISATFIYLTSTYYIDKFMMFRFCRTPPNYPKELEKSIRTICWIVIPLHCILSVWMLGSSKLFAGTSVKKNQQIIKIYYLIILFFPTLAI